MWKPGRKNLLSQQLNRIITQLLKITKPFIDNFIKCYLRWTEGLSVLDKNKNEGCGCWVLSWHNHKTIPETRLSRKCTVESAKNASWLLSMGTEDKDSRMVNLDPNIEEAIRFYDAPLPLRLMCFPQRWSVARHHFRYSNLYYTIVVSSSI